MKHRRAITILFVASLMFACATDAPTVRESLDGNTGVTFTRIDKPLILFHDNSAMAAHARDYVYLGPISVDRMGSYSYYLWIGVWSTVAQADSGRVRDGFESVVLYVDGEPFPLEVLGWTADTLGLSESAYIRPVASAADAYYRVTLDQIRLLAEADDILLRTSGTDSRSYLPWDRQRSTMAALKRFADSGR